MSGNSINTSESWCRQDLKYAARSLRRTPGFTVMAIATLALGIGANTAIFTLLDGVMFKPLNVPSPHELVTFYERPREGDPDSTGGTGRYLRFSYPRFERLRAAFGPAGWLAAMTGAGLILAFWAAAFLDALLFGVSTFDPLVAIVSVALLMGTTLAASYLPARRAARTDPVVALRQE